MLNKESEASPVAKLSRKTDKVVMLEVQLHDNDAQFAEGLVRQVDDNISHIDLRF